MGARDELAPEMPKEPPKVIKEPKKICVELQCKTN